METVTEVVKNMAGGDGEVTIKRILGEKELNGKCGLYAQVTIPGFLHCRCYPEITEQRGNHREDHHHG